MVSRRREQLVAAAAGELGLPATTTLSALADAAPDEDERRVLGERRQVMRAQVARISDLCAQNREILARNLAATTDALALLGDEPVVYGHGHDHRGGTAVAHARRPGLGGGPSMGDLALSIAASGLDAQQTAMDTISENLTNASTPGYVVESAQLTDRSRR